MTKPQVFIREAELGEPDGDRIPVVVSTEYPCEREDCIEVLAHDSEAHVDLTRAPLPLLTLHDHRKLPVGVIEDMRLDVAERVLRGFVRFGSTPEAQELARQVRERTLRWVSVGYWRLREVGRSSGLLKRFAWQPHEASLVAVPADPGAQFYRSQHQPRIQMSDQQKSAGDTGRNTEAERVKEIVALGRSYAKFLHANDVADACERGVSVEAFKDTIFSRMESRATNTSEAHIGMAPREVERYSFGRAIVASILGDWSKAGLEREASQAAARAWGRTAEGFFVPGEVWGRGMHRRDFNVGTASEAGNLVATELRGDLFVDALRERLVFSPLGVKFLTGLQGNVDIPRKSTPGGLGMLTEIGSASETAPVTTKLSLTPKRVGAYTEYSKQALIQSAIGLEGLIRDDLIAGAAVLLEYQMINGSGTAPNILGIRNTTGIGTVVAGTSGAAVTWSHFVDLEAAVANANASPGALAGYVASNKVRAKAKTVQRGTSLDFIIAGDTRAGDDGSVTINTYRAMFTNNVPSNLTKGTSSTVCSAALFSADWSQLVVGFWGGPDIVVDPYSLAATGQVRITLNQFADAGVRQPAAFAKVDDLLT